MSLRVLVRVLTLVLAVLAVLATTALIVLGIYERATTDALIAGLESVRFFQRVELQLLTHGSQENGPLRGALEADLRRVPLEGRRFVDTPYEQEQFDQLSSDLERYLHDSGAHPSPAERARDVQAVFRSAHELVNVNIAQADHSQRVILHWDRVMEVVGIALSVLLLAGGALVVVGLRRYAFEPVLRLGEAIRSLGAGQRDVRAPETGPVEVRELAATFNTLVRDLGRQRQMRLTFLAGVAHDLRNPLGALKLSVHALRQKDGVGPPGERLQRGLDLIERQVGHMKRLVNDLLDVLRLETGRLELDPKECDLRDLAQGALELFRASAGERELRVELAARPVRCTCDVGRIEQVLNNLISNAIKFSAPGTTVVVTARDDGPHAVLAVRDEGPGIAPELLRDLFEPFVRGARPDGQAPPGMGLGLWVARRIVEAHQGQIEVQSFPGIGTTFRVRLPVEGVGATAGDGASATGRS
jgi:signal transduction histidine kinase